jgi:hypothetical protein
VQVAGGAQMPATEDFVITSVEQEPLRSSYAVTRELVLPQALVLNVLYDGELHLYHCLQNYCQLPEDTPSQVEFCEKLRQQHAANVLYEYIFGLLKHVLCVRESSEATEVKSGYRLILMLLMHVDINPALVSESGLQFVGNIGVGSYLQLCKLEWSTILCFSSSCSARAT